MQDLSQLNKFRVKHPAGMGDNHNGAFLIHCNESNMDLRIIASVGEGWDHVSVSLKNRCPNWQEMDFVKRLFFNPDECVIQYHVPVKDHISIHNYCLHLWRPQGEKIPMPPEYMV